MAGIFVPVIVANSLSLVVLGGLYARGRKQRNAVGQLDSTPTPLTDLERDVDSAKNDEQRRQDDLETQDVESGFEEAGVAPEKERGRSDDGETLGSIIPVDPTAAIDGYDDETGEEEDEQEEEEEEELEQEDRGRKKRDANKKNNKRRKKGKDADRRRSAPPRRRDEGNV